MDRSKPQSGRRRILRVLLAAGLSFFFAGAGQVYNGQVNKGIAFIIAAVLLWFFFLGWVIGLWAAIDAGLMRWRLEKDGDTCRVALGRRPLLLFLFAACLSVAAIFFFASFHSRQGEEATEVPPAAPEDFARFPSEEVVWGGRFGSRSQFVSRTRDSRDVHSSGDFVCRLWHFFGEPEMGGDLDFLYAFEHRVTGVTFTAYSRDELAYSVAFPLPEGVDENDVNRILRQFEGLLASEDPEDCTVVYYTDHGTIRAGVEEGQAFEDYLSFCSLIEFWARHFREEECPDGTFAETLTPIGAAWNALNRLLEGEDAKSPHECGDKTMQDLRQMWRFVLEVVLGGDGDNSDHLYLVRLLKETASELGIPDELVERIPEQG